MLQAEDEDFGGEEAVNGFEGQFDAGEEQKEREECPVPAALARRMFPHQKEGVQWMYDLFLQRKGGILGDDMGLGKTFQVICLLAGLFESRQVKRVLVVCPLSVLQHWERELKQFLAECSRAVCVDVVVSETTKFRRKKILTDIFETKRPSVCVSTYTLIANCVDLFASEGRKWDYVILDEGHIIKNPATKLSKAMHNIPSRHRLLLSGTPIQNNLQELWAVMDWTTCRTLLGSRTVFKELFIDPILKGQDALATDTEKQLSEETARHLYEIIRPHLLQRKKEDVVQILPTVQKIDAVVWVKLSPKQRSEYAEYISGRVLESALARKEYPVEAVNALKTLCRHPVLAEASRRKRRLLDRIGEQIGDLLSAEEAEQERARRAAQVHKMSLSELLGRSLDTEELLQDCEKLRILKDLTIKLKRGGHRSLIFSQSRLMLDIISKVLSEVGIRICRIDGDVVGRERQQRIDAFNRTTELDVCLLTTRACAYGITLTGADRVIIYDPSWNPAEDRQAVDRAYRIGQTRDVVVYRLIMASAIEEKMYEKQVFKDGIKATVLESGRSRLYFNKDELRQLFTLGPEDSSLVLERLQTCATKVVDEEYQPVQNDAILGYSRHDALGSELEPVEIDEELSAQVAEKTQRLHNGDHTYRKPRMSEGRPRTKTPRRTKSSSDTERNQSSPIIIDFTTPDAQDTPGPADRRVSSHRTSSIADGSSGYHDAIDASPSVEVQRRGQLNGQQDDAASDDSDEVEWVDDNEFFTPGSKQASPDKTRNDHDDNESEADAEDDEDDCSEVDELADAVAATYLDDEAEEVDDDLVTEPSTEDEGEGESLHSDDEEDDEEEEEDEEEDEEDDSFIEQDMVDGDDDEDEYVGNEEFSQPIVIELLDSDNEDNSGGSSRVQQTEPYEIGDESEDAGYTFVDDDDDVENIRPLSPTSPTKPSSPDKHNRCAAPSLPSFKPRTQLDRFQVVEYNDWIACAVEKEAQGNLGEAIDCLVQALETCDDCPELHRKLFLLMRQVGITL